MKEVPEIAAPAAAVAARRARCDSWHLRLDKYSFKPGGGPDARTSALKDVRATYQESIPAYLSHACRAKNAFIDGLRKQHKARFAEVRLVATSRLLLHLGRANVLPNAGIHFDRTTGLPTIPGTSLKGLLSTWACWEANQRENGSFAQDAAFTSLRSESGVARRVLGDNSENGSRDSGEIVFVGGFPVKPPTMGLDILNPHYEVDGSDKRKLTPVVFLALEPDAEWRFVFFARPGAASTQDLLHATQSWLTAALTQIGIGAKTAAGYGRFKVPESNDYPNDASFKNRVLDRLNPGQLHQLETEIPFLQKPENGERLAQLKTALASKDYKDIQRRLRDKPWFPKEWLPTQ
jgi:CRISPR type III-B/RAMP module RAMP protein Cmr6